MKEKMRKVRYPMLIVWGIFMGAAGTAGVKSSWHVIPDWLIGVIVILGIMVMLTWMISGKNDKSIKTPEKETEKLTSKYNSEISVISKAVEEPVELEFWGKRNGIDQFRVKSIAERNIVSDHVLLISFDGSEARDVALDAVVTGKEHSEYFSKMPYANSDYTHLMLEHINEEYDEKLTNHILSLSSVHKLSYKLKHEAYANKENLYHRIIESYSRGGKDTRVK